MSDTHNAAAATPAANTPAPASPAAPSGSEGAPADSGGGVADFSGLDGSHDDVVETIEVSGEAPALPDVGQPATPAPAAPAAAVPAAAAQPAPAQPAAPAPQEAPSAASSSVDPGQMAQQLDQYQGAILADLAAKRFNLSQDEAAELEVNAPAAVSKLMAKTYYSAVQSALMHIQNFVPQMVMTIVKQMQASDELEGTFFKDNPALSRDKHLADVYSFARSFRQTQPQLAQKDLLSMVAAAVMAKHGLFAQPQQPGVPVGQPPGAPPIMSAPSFVPARPGTAVRTTPVQENPWEGLGRDFDD